MKMQVINNALCVGGVRIIEVSRSSVFLIGDTEQIVCSSIVDTPADCSAFSSNQETAEENNDL
jgi:spore germination protein PD